SISTAMSLTSLFVGFESKSTMLSSLSLFIQYAVCATSWIYQMEIKVVNMRRSTSLTRRVEVLVGMGNTLVVLAFNWMIVRSLEHHFTEQDAGELQAVANAVVKTLQTPNLQADPEAMSQQLSAIAIGHHGISYGVLKRSGTPVYLSSGPDLAPV